MRQIVLFLFLSPLLLASSIVPAATAGSARVVLKPSNTYGTEWPNLQGFVREAVFLLGSKDYYSIDCRGGRDITDPKKPYTPGKGGFCMGMPGPFAEGWYCYGFLNVILNGQEASTTMVSSMEVSEQGHRAIVDSVWRMEVADVRVRFLGLPGRDFLFCELALDPKQETKSLEVSALCFPAFFTGFYRREQARFVQTPSTLLREEEGRRNIQLAPKDNWWLIYGDDFFDVAKTKESAGPCALMILPESISSLGIAKLDYGVTTTISIAPEARKIRMAFWKMKGKTNADAIDELRTHGESIRKELATLDFTPESLKTFDLPGITTDIERVAHSAAVGNEFQKKAAEVLAWIKDHSADLTAKGDSVSATEQKLQLLQTYNDFIYEARLAEILATLEK